MFVSIFKCVLWKAHGISTETSSYMIILQSVVWLWLSVLCLLHSIHVFVFETQQPPPDDISLYFCHFLCSCSSWGLSNPPLTDLIIFVWELLDELEGCHVLLLWAIIPAWWHLVHLTSFILSVCVVLVGLLQMSETKMTHFKPPITLMQQSLCWLFYTWFIKGKSHWLFCLKTAESHSFFL